MSTIAHDASLAETASLAVDPAVRDQDIGYRLRQARRDEVRALRLSRVRTEMDRPAPIEWYMRNSGYRKVGGNPKKHAFGLEDVDHWTVLELDL